VAGYISENPIRNFRIAKGINVFHLNNEIKEMMNN
jgi:hypothetical protein